MPFPQILHEAEALGEGLLFHLLSEALLFRMLLEINEQVENQLYEQTEFPFVTLSR